MRFPFCCFVIAGLFVVAHPCRAIDVPPSGQVPEYFQQVDVLELLFRKLVKTSNPPSRLDLDGLIALQRKIALEESQAKARLKAMQEIRPFSISALNNLRQSYESLKTVKNHHPNLARAFKDVERNLQRAEQSERENPYPLVEARAKQAVSDWQKLSRIVASVIDERRRALKAAQPDKK